MSGIRRIRGDERWLWRLRAIREECFRWWALLESGIIINKQTKNTRITNHATLYIKFIRSFCARAHAGTGRMRKREYIMSCSDLILFHLSESEIPSLADKIYQLWKHYRLGTTTTAATNREPVGRLQTATNRSVRSNGGGKARAVFVTFIHGLTATVFYNQFRDA